MPCFDQCQDIAFLGPLLTYVVVAVLIIIWIFLCWGNGRWPMKNSCLRV